eukprot:1652140-Pyramimonas_sp.AAC.1
MAHLASAPLAAFSETLETSIQHASPPGSDNQHVPAGVQRNHGALEGGKWHDGAAGARRRMRVIAWRKV